VKKRRVKLTGLQTRVLVLVLLVVIFSIFVPYFLGIDNFTNILVNGSVVGIIACAMTLLLVARQIDISVGSSVAFSAAVFAATAEKHSLIFSLVLALLAACFVAVINIVSIVYLRIESIIVTLACLIAFRGLTKVVLDGRSISVQNFDFIGAHRINLFGIVALPIPVLICFFVFLYFALIMKYTKYGHHMYAIGANPESSRLAGIKLELQISKAFLLMALAVFLAMIASVSMIGMAAPTTGDRLEFLALTAVILGGVGLAGGRGNVLGTLVAVLILAVIDNALVLFGVKPFWQEVARGGLLLLAIIFDQFSRTRDKTVRMEV